MFSYLFRETWGSNKTEAFIIANVCLIVSIPFLLFYVNRFIYATIDSQNHSLVYGNMILSQEIPLTEVKFLGYFLAYKSIIKIKVGGTTYFYMSGEPNTEQQFSK